MGKGYEMWVWVGCVSWMRDCCGCSSCAQEAWFIGVCVRARLWEHNEADLGTKMVDVRRMTSLLKGNTPSTANGFELMDGGGDSHPRLQRQQKIAVY